MVTLVETTLCKECHNFFRSTDGFGWEPDLSKYHYDEYGDWVRCLDCDFCTSYHNWLENFKLDVKSN